MGVSEFAARRIRPFVTACAAVAELATLTEIVASKPPSYVAVFVAQGSEPHAATTSAVMANVLTTSAVPRKTYAGTSAVQTARPASIRLNRRALLAGLYLFRRMQTARHWASTAKALAANHRTLTRHRRIFAARQASIAVAASAVILVKRVAWERTDGAVTQIAPSDIMNILIRAAKYRASATLAEP